MSVQTVTTWVDARREQPRDRDLVLAAITGRYPTRGAEAASSEQDFWLVLPMHFHTELPVEDSDDVLHDCYRDPDGVIREAAGGGTAEVVTHWAAIPPLPGLPVSEVLGASAAGLLTTATDLH